METDPLMAIRAVHVTQGVNSARIDLIFEERPLTYTWLIQLIFGGLAFCLLVRAVYLTCKQKEHRISNLIVALFLFFTIVSDEEIFAFSIAPLLVNFFLHTAGHYPL